VALITGSGPGIGRGDRATLCKRGRFGFFAARHGGRTRCTAKEITAAGGKAAFVIADLTRAADAEELVAAGRASSAAWDIL